MKTKNDPMKPVPPGGLQRGESIEEFFNPSPWHFHIYYFLGALIFLLGFPISAFTAAGGAFILGGLALLLMTELYRRGHRYYIPTQRFIREKVQIVA